MSFENDKTENVEKEDLLRLLACLQSELEAREEVINTLRLERLHAVNFRAKYGFGDIERTEAGDSKDPFYALQRDSLVVPSNPAHAEADLKPLYDTQLVQLENLITSQRRAQDTMREQLLIMESKYLKVCKELEDERNKHERDAAQGDDVLVMLEKERERLKSEVEYERGLNRKLEKDLRKVLGAMKEQAILLNTQKMAAVSIIRERHRLCSDRKSSSDHAFTRPGKSNEIGSTPPANVEPSDSPSGKEHSPVSHENSPCGAFGEGTFVSRECIRLRRLLTEEINARKVLQDQFERLQKEHQELINHTNKKDLSFDSTHAVPQTGSLEPLRSVAVDRSSVPNLSTSAVSTQRPKPNPPMRRSSEISNNLGLVSHSLTNVTGDLSPVNGTNTSELNINVDSEGHPSGPASPDSSSISPSSPLSVNVPVNSATTSPIQRPSSRSSTPSPPPPPPPIQLHYPYPGIQSHLHHGQPRSTGINSPFIPNTTRPASVSMTHGMTTKSRPALSSHGSHPANSSYQTPFVSMSPQTQTSRMSFTPPARAGVPRKPSTVVAHPSHGDTSTNSSTYSVPFVSTQSKASLPNQSQYPPRTAAQHLMSPAGGHHFPAYPAVRQHISTGSSTTALGNVRAARTSVPSASSALSSSGGQLGSGHVCINGK